MIRHNPLNTRQHRHSVRRQTGQGGISLVSMGIYLLVATILTGVFMATRFAAAQQGRAEQAAKMLQDLTVASSQYLSGEASTVAGALTIGGPPIAIPMTNNEGFAAPSGLPSVQAAGYLPAAYSDVDPFGQSHALLVREVTPPPGTSGPSYEAMIVSFKGTSIPTPLVGQIVEQSSGTGGFVSPTSTSRIDGAYGTWQSPVSNWSGNSANIPLNTGHYMATLQFSPPANSIGSYLDRYSVPGDPELNTMHTDIRMANNSLVGTNVVAFNNGGGIASGSGGVITLSPDGTYSSGTLSSTSGGTVAVNGALTVSGNGSVSGNLNDTGTTTAGAVSAGSANITNNLSIGGSEAVIGGASIGGNLGVTGNSTFSGTVSAPTVTATTLNATSASAGTMSVQNNANVTGTTFAQQLVPTASATIGSGCAHNGEISYSSASGLPAFCEAGTYVAWAGGQQVSLPNPTVYYSGNGSGGYVATLSAAGCQPGQQTTVATNSWSNTPPPGYSPTMDLGFVCGQDQQWQPLLLPAP